MIVNKTSHFMKIRQQPPKEFIPSFSTGHLRDSLKALNIEIASFGNKLERSTLPSFNSRERRSKEIKDARERIEGKIKEIDAEIRGLNVPEKAVAESAQQYFLDALKKLLVAYRGIEQKSLEVPEPWGGSVQHPEYSNDVEECMAQELLSRNAAIKSSIFSLSNTIVQLKTTLKSQTSAIDTIDFYFDKANTYLEEANKEIGRIPGKYTSFKDMVIYCLLYLICILLCLVLVKAYKSRPKSPSASAAH